MAVWRERGVALALVLLVAAGYALAWQESRAGEWSFLLWAGGPTVLCAVLGAAWMVWEDGEYTWLTPRWGDASVGFLGGAFVFGGAWLLTKQMAPVDSPQLAWLVRIYYQLGPSEPLRANLYGVMFGLFVLALAEEVLWRGVMIRLLEPTFGSRRAWIAAAIAYALAQLPTVFVLADPVAGPNPLLFLGALGAGLVWGVLARMYGRIAPGVIAHFAFDWVVVVMMRLWGQGI